MNDLAQESEYKVKVKELFDGLLQLQKEMNDPLILESLDQYNIN